MSLKDMQKLIELAGDGYRVTHRFGRMKQTSSGTNGMGPFGSPAGYSIRPNTMGRKLAWYVVENAKDERERNNAMWAYSHDEVSEDHFSSVIDSFVRLTKENK